MPAGYSQREYARRYKYGRWFYGTERAEWRTVASRKYRHRIKQLLKTTNDFHSVAFPLPPKTGGWLTW